MCRPCRAALVHHRSENAGRLDDATPLPVRCRRLPGDLRRGPPSRRLGAAPAVALSGSPRLRSLDRERPPVGDAGRWPPMPNHART